MSYVGALYVFQCSVTIVCTMYNVYTLISTIYTVELENDVDDADV